MKCEVCGFDFQDKKVMRCPRCGGIQKCGMACSGNCLKCHLTPKENGRASSIENKDKSTK